MSNVSTRAQALASQTILPENPDDYIKIKSSKYSHDAMELMLESIDSKEFNDSFEHFVKATCAAKAAAQRECSLLCCNPVCSNAKIQNGREHPKQLIISKSNDKGHILLAGEKFNVGDFICEYVGEIVTTKEWIEKHQNDEEASPLYTFNLINPATDLMLKIDAQACGNEARFISHSCSPNATAENWVLPNNDITVAIFATAPIMKNHEITISYGESYREFKIPCKCGSPVCRGIIC